MVDGQNGLARLRFGTMATQICHVLALAKLYLGAGIQVTRNCTIEL